MLAGAVLTAASYALTAALGDVPIPLVMIALVLSGIAAPFFMGGLSSFVADEFPDARRGYAHDALSYNVGSVGGPALVAVLAVAGSARTALLVLGAICLLGCAGLFALRLTPRPAPGVGALRTMATGLRHLVAHRPIAIVTLSGTLSQLGAGGLAVAMAICGEPFYLNMPTVLGVKLTGKLPDWVSAKDVILEMLRRHDCIFLHLRALNQHSRASPRVYGHSHLPQRRGSSGSARFS